MSGSPRTEAVSARICAARQRIRRRRSAACRHLRSWSSTPTVITLKVGADPGEGYDWPQQIHGLYIDYKGNLWVSSERAGDNHILKFTRDGKFLLQIGKPGQSTGNNDKVNVNRAADMHVHREDQRIVRG